MELTVSLPRSGERPRYGHWLCTVIYLPVGSLSQLSSKPQILIVLDIDNRPYVRNLLQGLIAEREEMMEHRKSTDIPEGQEVSYLEPAVNMEDAIERSDLKYEEGNEAEWTEAQQYLSKKGLVTLKGSSDQDGLHSTMQFVSPDAVDLGKQLLG